VKKLIKKIPGVLSAKKAVQAQLMKMSLARKPTVKVFSDIYETNKWGSNESVSGPGSSLEQTRVIREYLEVFLPKHGVRTILDVPCGDFNWMSRVDLGDIRYTGADIVPDLIQSNNRRFARENVNFITKDLTRDPLDTFDLVLCRDCLMHLSNAQVVQALKNICATSSKYLLTTGFTNTSTNHDIAHGQWRAINLTAPPFSLSNPLKIVNEELKDYGGQYSDKSLMLWELDSIRGEVYRLR
jgi:SAM-dependent methyltransferase